MKEEGLILIKERLKVFREKIEKDEEIKIIQSQMQSILEIICNMNEGTGKNEIAKQLIEKNIYKKRK